MAESIKTYRDLIAWQKAYTLGKTAYAATSRFPEAERFGLTSSVRRTALSIASHIAQGYGQGRTQDYIWFLKQARGELYLLDTQLLFSVDFKHLADDEYQQVKKDLDETERVLAGLIRSLGG